MGAEAGGDAVEVAVVVAGVAAEFVGAGGWEGAQDFGESSGVELAGGGDGDGAVGGEDFCVADLRVGFEAGAQAADEADAKAAQGAALVQIERPLRFEGVADGADGGALGDVEEWAGDGGEEVSVFVGVDVGDVDAGALEFLNLGDGFAGDLVLTDSAAKQGLEEVEQRGTRTPDILLVRQAL